MSELTLNALHTQEQTLDVVVHREIVRYSSHASSSASDTLLEKRTRKYACESSSVLGLTDPRCASLYSSKGIKLHRAVKRITAMRSQIEIMMFDLIISGRVTFHSDWQQIDPKIGRLLADALEYDAYRLIYKNVYFNSRMQNGVEQLVPYAGH